MGESEERTEDVLIELFVILLLSTLLACCMFPFVCLPVNGSVIAIE